ncbi:MAG: hypothetical protein Q8K72_14165, partial [Acidimicrobiales bacterium]|nr:hypothetical protein [Acidimicrobiales bacterium]
MCTHRRLPLRVLLCATLLAGACAVGPGAVASARTPDDDPARGLRYGGLERAAAGACAGRFELRGNASPGDSPLCSHGPDAAPDGVDVRVPRAPESPSETTLRSRAAVAAEDPPCAGDGSSGRRVQLVYAHVAGRPDRSEAFAASFTIWAASTDDVFQRSAAETGGSRQITFVHDPVTCAPTVAKATLSTTGEIDYWTSVEEMYHQGFNRNDRKYLVWVDANHYCGIAAYHDDDRPGQNNDNNNYSGYARVDNGCWGIPGASMEAHELMHVLGGVQDSAPNATGAMHCTDDYDLMCYSDRSGLPMVYRCPYTHENTFD